MDERTEQQEVDVYAAAVRAAVAELGDMPAEVIEWRRKEFEGAVEVAALTW